jgi:hypothetical protein
LAVKSDARAPCPTTGRFDADNSGGIDLAEFGALWAHLNQPEPAPDPATQSSAHGRAVAKTARKAAAGKALSQQLAERSGELEKQWKALKVTPAKPDMRAQVQAQQTDSMPLTRPACIVYAMHWSSSLPRATCVQARDGKHLPPLPRVGPCRSVHTN